MASDEETDFLLKDSWSPCPPTYDDTQWSSKAKDEQRSPKYGDTQWLPKYSGDKRRSPKYDDREWPSMADDIQCSPSYGVRQSSPTSFKSPRNMRKFKERVPDRFDGSSPWRDYWAHFKACWDLNEWSDEEAALVLASSLSKSACKVLNPKPKDTRGRERSITIDELRKRLERRYGPGELAESFLAQLKTRRQGSRESIQELGEAIGELVRQAYPEAPNQFLERMGVVHFRDSIMEAEIRAALYRTRPASLDEAIKTATEAESFMEVEAQRDRPRYVRTVEKSETKEVAERLDRMEKRQDELMRLLTDMTVSQKSESRPERGQMGPIQCYNCSELGHIKRNCPYLRYGYPLNENRSTPGSGRGPAAQH